MIKLCGAIVLWLFLTGLGTGLMHGGAPEFVVLGLMIYGAMALATYLYRANCSRASR